MPALRASPRSSRAAPDRARCAGGPPARGSPGECRRAAMSWVPCEEATTEMLANRAGPTPWRLTLTSPGACKHVDGVVAGLLQRGPGSPTHAATLRARHRPADERALDRLDVRHRFFGEGGGAHGRHGQEQGTERYAWGTLLDGDHAVTSFQRGSAGTTHVQKRIRARHMPGVGTQSGEPAGRDRHGTTPGPVTQFVHCSPPMVRTAVLACPLRP